MAEGCSSKRRPDPGLSWVTLNSAYYGGGVFQAGATHKLILTDSLIDGNTAVYHGGGAYADGIVEYNNSTLSNNTAGWHGGGLFANIGNTQLTNGSITANHTTNGDGGGVDANNNINVLGTSFSNNTAGGSGGGLSQWSRR